MRVFVTGGTGLVGTRLIRKLRERGDEVVLLTRRPAAARERFGNDVEIAEGDPMQAGPWMNAVEHCDAIIHLAGENVFNKRWNETFKKLMYESRIRSTENVVQALLRQPRRANGEPKILVSTSAIGYYGPCGDEELDEASPPQHDHHATICVDWEKAALAAESAGIRVALVRVGIVLDRTGGALAKLLLPFKLGVGGPIGSGKQWMSWIHHADMIGLFLFALDQPEARGPLNGTAPNPVTNKEFSRILGRVLHRPAFFWTPGFLLRIALGEVANVITTGQRVVPRVPLRLGYSYQYPTLEVALREIVSAK